MTRRIKPMLMPKKVRRQLSADESLQRYLAHERRWQCQWVDDQLNVLQVFQGGKLLQIKAVHRTGNGIIVEVV